MSTHLRQFHSCSASGLSIRRATKEAAEESSESFRTMVILVQRILRSCLDGLLLCIWIPILLHLTDQPTVAEGIPATLPIDQQHRIPKIDRMAFAHPVVLQILPDQFKSPFESATCVSLDAQTQSFRQAS